MTGVSSLKKLGVASATISALALLGWMLIGYRSVGQVTLSAATKPASPSDHGEVFAASLHGTQVDGRLETAADKLVLTPELLHLFDYYLASLGERSLPEIIAQVKHELRQSLQLKPAALAQALALFDSYLAYKRALLQAPTPAPNGHHNQSKLMQASLAFLQASRAQFFSNEEILALFSEQQLRDQDALQRMQVFEDASLNSSQKQAAYQALDQALPAALRVEKNAPVYIQQIEQQVAQMRANGKDEQAIYEFRALNFSADAAARLNELEREERLWQQRIATYQNQAQQIIKQARDAPVIPLSQEQIQHLAKLRQQSFSADEMPRLAAYETWATN